MNSWQNSEPESTQAFWCMYQVIKNTGNRATRKITMGRGCNQQNSEYGIVYRKSNRFFSTNIFKEKKKKEEHQEKGSANIFRKGINGKFFVFCRPCGL